MKTRDVARLLVLNGHHEVLLVRYDDESAVDPRKGVRSYWVPPGGGVHEGETSEEAALRELREETGLHLKGALRVWLRERELFRKGELTLHREQYFFACVAGRPSVSNMESSEGITDCKWRSLDELLDSGDVIFPDNFIALMKPLVAGDVPATPIFIEGVDS